MSSFGWFFDCLTEWSISCFVWVIFFIWVLIIFWHLRSKIDERQISYFRKMSSVIIWKKKVNLSWDLYNGNIGIKIFVLVFEPMSAAWKVFVFGVILVVIFQHLDWTLRSTCSGGEGPMKYLHLFIRFRSFFSRNRSWKFSDFLHKISLSSHLNLGWAESFRNKMFLSAWSKGHKIMFLFRTASFNF